MLGRAERPSSQAEPSSSRTHALVSLDQFGRSGVTASSSSLITSASMPALLPSARRHLPEDAADALDWRLSVMQQLLLSGSTQLAARQSAAEETVRTILFRWRYRDEFLALQSLKANAKRERLLYGGVLAVLPSRRGRMLEALFTMRGAAAAAQHASLVCAQASSREALSAWREALPALRAERADRCARREHREHARRRAPYPPLRGARHAYPRTGGARAARDRGAAARRLGRARSG